MTPYEIKVYKIWYEDEPDEFYIGSTKYDRLSRRMDNHRCTCRFGKEESRLYETMREKGINNFKYIQIASYMVYNSDERRMFEQKWIDKLKPSLNRYKAYSTKEDRRQSYMKYCRKPEIIQRRKENNQKPEEKEKRKQYNKNLNRKTPLYCCYCDISVKICGKSTHRKTKKHMDNVYKKFKEHFNL